MQIILVETHLRVGGYNQIFNLLMTEGTNQLLINSTSNLTRYLVYSSLVSSLGSGWF